MINKLTLTACGLTVNFGLYGMTEADLTALLEISCEKGVLADNAAMREGQIVNAREGRAA